MNLRQAIKLLPSRRYGLVELIQVDSSWEVRAEDLDHGLETMKFSCQIEALAFISGRYPHLTRMIPATEGRVQALGRPPLDKGT